MSKKRSDALSALVAEVVDLSTALDVELDTARTVRESAERRLETTEEALRIIQQRDDVSAETIEALMARSGSPRRRA